MQPRCRRLNTRSRGHGSTQPAASEFGVDRDAHRNSSTQKSADVGASARNHLGDEQFSCLERPRPNAEQKVQVLRVYHLSCGRGLPNQCKTASSKPSAVSPLDSTADACLHEAHGAILATRTYCGEGKVWQSGEITSGQTASAEGSTQVGQTTAGTTGVGPGLSIPVKLTDEH